MAFPLVNRIRWRQGGGGLAGHDAGQSYRRKFLLEPLESRVLLSAGPLLADVYRTLLEDHGPDVPAIVEQVDALTSTQISAAVRGAFEPAPTVDWPATWRAPASDVLYVVDE